MTAQNSPLIQKRDAVRTAYEKIAQFKERSNQSLYETLAETLGFVKLGLETKNRDEYEKMLRDADLSPRDNSNVYLPAIKLLFRKKNKDGTETPIASAYKYAKAIRYFLEEGITEDMVVEHILGCEFEKKKKLLAIYAKDSKRHRDDRGGVPRTRRTRSTSSRGRGRPTFLAGLAFRPSSRSRPMATWWSWPDRSSRIRSSCGRFSTRTKRKSGGRSRGSSRQRKAAHQHRTMRRRRRCGTGPNSLPRTSPLRRRRHE